MGQLTTIGLEAFFTNIQLTALNFGGLSQTTLQIDSTAFDSCTTLRQVNYQTTGFLSKLTNISGGARHMYIQRNTNNTVLNIDFQDAINLTSIKTNEFQGQSQLTALNNFDKATNLLNIGNEAFDNCDLRYVDSVSYTHLTLPTT